MFDKKQPLFYIQNIRSLYRSWIELKKLSLSRINPHFIHLAQNVYLQKIVSSPTNLAEIKYNYIDWFLIELDQIDQIIKNEYYKGLVNDIVTKLKSVYTPFEILQSTSTQQIEQLSMIEFQKQSLQETIQRRITPKYGFEYRGPQRNRINKLFSVNPIISSHNLGSLYIENVYSSRDYRYKEAYGFLEVYKEITDTGYSGYTITVVRLDTLYQIINIMQKKNNPKKIVLSTPNRTIIKEFNMKTIKDTISLGYKTLYQTVITDNNVVTDIGEMTNFLRFIERDDERKYFDNIPQINELTVYGSPLTILYLYRDNRNIFTITIKGMMFINCLRVLYNKLTQRSSSIFNVSLLDCIHNIRKFMDIKEYLCKNVRQTANSDICHEWCNNRKPNEIVNYLKVYMLYMTESKLAELNANFDYIKMIKVRTVKDMLSDKIFFPIYFNRVMRYSR